MVVEPFWNAQRLCSLKVNRCAGVIALLLFLVLFFIVGMVLARIWYRNRCERRIGGIIVSLKTMRRCIAFLDEEHGGYPGSFTELRRSLGRSGSGNWDRMYVDLTADRQEVVPEYRELNDKGGYYYDPNSGELRLNLTRPVREYLRWYKGAYADQIPSHW
jgi:hypothetical protein